MVNKPELKDGDLKCCPFCGGEADVSQGEQGGLPYYYIECFDCSAMADSVMQWNKRHSPEAHALELLLRRATVYVDAKHMHIVTTMPEGPPVKSPCPACDLLAEIKGALPQRVPSKEE